VTVPDIVITENKAGALVKDGILTLLFPSDFTLNSTQSGASVSYTGGETGAMATSLTTDTTSGTAANALHLTIDKASTSSTGAYTITISGITGDVGANASGVLAVTIGGGSSTAYSASTFGSNYGAKPYSESADFASVVSGTIPFADTATVGAAGNVTQTFIAAGNDTGKVGDIYVFTNETTPQYYDGSTWSTTEAVYSDGATLGTHTITYDPSTLATATGIYIGHGVGLSGTYAVMNTNGTFVSAYTTPSTVEVGKDAGGGTAEQNVNDAIELYLNITNDDGYDPAADFAYEWLVFGATVGGADAGLFFYTNDPNAASAVVAYDASLDLTTVAYTFDHTSDSFKVSDLNMGTLGLSAGDQFWYGYVYGLTGFDLADTTTWSLENYTFITAK
jgi:hypothetical protein